MKIQYDPYADSHARWAFRTAILLLASLVLVFLLFGCASAKPCPPCPPVEIITVAAPPVMLPCQQPPEIRAPDLWLVKLSASGATIQEILTAAEHDREEFRAVLAEYVKAVEAYRIPGP